MNTAPTLRCGSTLVIFDGPQRLTWRSTSPGQCTPVALWPDADQFAQVDQHLSGGGAVLILVQEERSSIPMLAEEAARAPQPLAARLTADGELAELRLEALDWLPEPLRERGRRFLRRTAGLIKSQPELLLPHLLVEEPGEEPGNLRFARLRTPRPLSDDRLGSAVRHLFALPAPGAAPTVRLTAMEAVS